jgi:hypothetical protein
MKSWKRIRLLRERERDSVDIYRERNMKEGNLQ